MGPWCADRAALHLLAQIEKQKVKTPYERHFLLLCLVSTTFVQIRAFSDFMFQKIPSEKERIERYSSPKVLRLLQTLKLFKPEVTKKDDGADNEVLNKLAEDLENMDIPKLATCLEAQIKTVSEHKNGDASRIVDGLESILNIVHPETVEKRITQHSGKELESTTAKYGSNIKRPKRKYQPGSRFKANQNANDPDALCGIIFCNDKNTAKILFNLLYEVSRHDPDLDFLKVQYTVDRVADPLKEAKEAEIEHRKQEEVLKRFRMHECNVLIGTSVLEEGIDLPKCNLVVRWDPPSTYRSYVQCKGRARASQAFHMILVGSDIDCKSVDNETLCDGSHYFVCSRKIPESLVANEEPTSNGDDETEKQEMHRVQCVVEPSSEKEDNNRRIYEHGLVEMKNTTEKMVESLAQYIEIEKVMKLISVLTLCFTESMYFQMLLRKCANVEPAENEHEVADRYNESIEPYKPLPELLTGASVNLGTAISLINRYCAKLPSDTFTKLTPIWRCAQTIRNGVTLYQYTLRLPINSRLKRDILVSAFRTIM